MAISDSLPSAGRLLVVSGPGGVGKGTVVAALTRRRDDLTVSLSATTRPPRPGEEEGVHYRFLDETEFARMIADGEFLEWAEFNGRRYGTPWSSVVEPLAEGRTVVLEIDVQGALQVRQRLLDQELVAAGAGGPPAPRAVLVFLAPPSMDVLAQRLRDRGSEGDAAIARRLEIAAAEIAQADVFDHVVPNIRVEQAVAAIEGILDSTSP